MTIFFVCFITVHIVRKVYDLYCDKFFVVVSLQFTLSEKSMTYIVTLIVISTITLSVKRNLITSSECHSLKSTASTWILIGHRLGKFILHKHIWKNLSVLQSKRRKMRWNRKRSSFKNHRNCLPLRLGVRSRQKPVRRLRNPLLKLNE